MRSFNYRRGLLRLWIVATLGWIALILILAAQDPPEPAQQPIAQASMLIGDDRISPDSCDARGSLLRPGISRLKSLLPERTNDRDVETDLVTLTEIDLTEQAGSSRAVTLEICGPPDAAQPSDVEVLFATERFLSYRTRMQDLYQQIAEQRRRDFYVETVAMAFGPPTVLLLGFLALWYIGRWVVKGFVSGPSS